MLRCDAGLTWCGPGLPDVKAVVVLATASVADCALVPEATSELIEGGAEACLSDWL